MKHEFVSASLGIHSDRAHSERAGEEIIRPLDALQINRNRDVRLAQVIVQRGNDVHAILGNPGLSRLNQLHVAGDPGSAVPAAAPALRVVHADGQHVFAMFEQFRDIEKETHVTVHVASGFLPVHIDLGPVKCSVEMDLV